MKLRTFMSDLKRAWNTAVIVGEMMNERQIKRKEPRPSYFSGRNTMSGLREEDMGWISYGADYFDGLNLGDLSEIRKQSLKKWLKDPYACSILNTILYFMIGKDIEIIPLTAENERRWRRFTERNRNWKKGFREFVLLGIVLGESIVIRSPVSSLSTYGNKKQDKSLRYLGADELIWMSPSGIKSYIAAVDSETGKGNPKDIRYLVFENAKRQEIRYHASDFARLTFDDYGLIQGRPIFERVLQLMTKYNKYIDAEMSNAVLYASLPIIRKVKPGMVKKLASELTTLPPPPSIITVSNEEEWTRPDMGNKPAGIGIESAIARIASGVGLPSHMISSESRKSGYGETISGDLGVREIFDGIRIQIVQPFLESVSSLIFGNYDFKVNIKISKYGKMLDVARAAALGVKEKGLPKSIFSEIFDRNHEDDLKKIEEESKLAFLKPDKKEEGIQNPVR